MHLGPYMYSSQTHFSQQLILLFSSLGTQAILHGKHICFKGSMYHLKASSEVLYTHLSHKLSGPVHSQPWLQGMQKLGFLPTFLSKVDLKTLVAKYDPLDIPQLVISQ